MKPPFPHDCTAHARDFGRSLLLAFAVVLVIGCAGIPLHPAEEGSYDYFAIPDSDDPWSPKIAGWQRRERADVPGVAAAESAGSDEFERPGVARASVNGGGDLAQRASEDDPALRTKYDNFRAERRREMAREFAEWIQSEAKQHYVPDGPIDHWATLEETLRSDGDDCDGLELLVFHGLRDLGFESHEVFRAVVYRPDDGQHHMVTLWFEDRDDPWVIDPTGAMSSGLHRMSEIPGWEPLKVFSDDREFSARRATMLEDSLAAR